MKEMESHGEISQRSMKYQVAVHGLSFRTKNRNKQQGPFHDAQSMITMNHTDQELNEVIRSSKQGDSNIAPYAAEQNRFLSRNV